MTKLVPCDAENPPLWAGRLAGYVLDRTVSFFAGFDGSAAADAAFFGAFLASSSSKSCVAFLF